MKKTIALVLFLGIALSALASENHHEASVVIDANGRQMAGIKIAIVKQRNLPEMMTAPGEVLPNADQSSVITSRIPAQVMKRFAQVGDLVKKNQPLVELSSVEMARAQGDFLMAAQKWRRLKKLKRGIVPAQDYDLARIHYQQSYGRLIAYGMIKRQVEKLLRTNDPKNATGRFTLLARRDGTITRSRFVEGQMIKPGELLFDVINESSFWIHAKVSPELAQKVRKGANARIVSRFYTLEGKVIRTHHHLDTGTRTRTLLIEVPDAEHRLHPGQFVECEIEVGRPKLSVAIPKTALLRNEDGDWIAYLETKPNVFTRKKVTVDRVVGDQVAVNGLRSGEYVVTKGAFFVRSELMKHKFSAHNH